METVALALLALALVLLNGFFVAAEFAIVKLRLTQADELAATAGWPGRILRSVRSHLDAYLSACQLGITLASLGLGWIGEPAFAHLLAPLLRALGAGSESLVDAISFAVAFALISFLHIVVGELAPKSLAIRQAERVSLWTGPPLFLFYWLMYPFIRVLNGSANWLLRGIGVQTQHLVEDPHSAAELKSMLVASHRHGELSGRVTDLLTRTLEASDLTAGDLMHPAGQLVALDLRQPLADNLAIVDRHQYSRYPVFDGGTDELAGLVHIKDLYAALRRPDGLADLRGLLRAPLVVHRHANALALLRSQRSGQPHLALVVDDRGTITGFATLSQLLAALVGDIRDEFHETHRGWSLADDGSYVITGALPVRELERLIGTTLPSGGASSAGGLVMARLDMVPRVGQRVALDAVDLEVLEMRGPRILKLRAIPKASMSVPESA